MSTNSEYTKKDGSVVSEDWMDRIAEAAESDELPGVVVTTQTHAGRPRLYEDDELVTISVRLPKSRLAAVEQRAKRAGETRSDFIRSAVDHALALG